MNTGNIDFDAVSTLYEDENLRLGFLPGNSNELILAITGIGHRIGANQTEEFVRSASADGERNVLFVVDKKRSWFTQPGVIENTCEHSMRIMQRLGCDSVATVGSSMGGYGAILFSKFLPVSNAVAFAPQYSMNRLVVFERRWREYRKHIKRAPVPGLNEAIVNTTKYFIVYGNDSRDRRHLRKFAPAQNLFLFCVQNGEHNPAKHLKERGVLFDLLSSGLSGDSERFSEILEALDE